MQIPVKWWVKVKLTVLHSWAQTCWQRLSLKLTCKGWKMMLPLHHTGRQHMYLRLENDFIYLVVMETDKQGRTGQHVDKIMGKYFGLYPVIDTCTQPLYFLLPNSCIYYILKADVFFFSLQLFWLLELLVTLQIVTGWKKKKHWWTLDTVHRSQMYICV